MRPKVVVAWCGIYYVLQPLHKGKGMPSEDNHIKIVVFFKTRPWIMCVKLMLTSPIYTTYYLMIQRDPEASRTDED
jgi:hypothetical protein